jgi:hypothetical protein
MEISSLGKWCEIDVASCIHKHELGGIIRFQIFLFKLIFKFRLKYSYFKINK